MIRKTALLTTIAGALFVGAPALAQDQSAQAPAASEAPAPAKSLTLQPGATVKGSDGVELGKLVGVQNGASGQELTVRGENGELRGVSVAGIQPDGDAISVAATSAEYLASPVITEGAAPAAQPDPAQSSDADTTSDASQTDDAGSEEPQA